MLTGCQGTQSDIFERLVSRVRGKMDIRFKEGALEQGIGDTQLSPLLDLLPYPRRVVHQLAPQTDHQDRSLDDPSGPAKEPWSP